MQDIERKKTGNYLWVARDKNGEVWLYQNKPERRDVIGKWIDNKVWHQTGNMRLNKRLAELFASLKWSDEPRRIRFDFSDEEGGQG